jgi:hypothetical protein
MGIQWEVTEDRTGVRYSVNCNVVATGSKQWERSEAEENMEGQPEMVKITIADADDPDRVLVEESVPLQAFKTGSVGYKFQRRDVTFDG